MNCWCVWRTFGGTYLAGVSAVHRLMQPGLRHAPFALNRYLRDAQDFGHLFDRQAAEETQLDDAALPRVERGQTPERVVQKKPVNRPLFARETDSLVQR